MEYPPPSPRLARDRGHKHPAKGQQAITGRRLDRPNPMPDSTNHPRQRLCLRPILHRHGLLRDQYCILAHPLLVPIRHPTISHLARRI